MTDSLSHKARIAIESAQHSLAQIGDVIADIENALEDGKAEAFAATPKREKPARVVVWTGAALVSMCVDGTDAKLVSRLSIGLRLEALEAVEYALFMREERVKG